MKKLVAALPYILKPNTGKALIWARREGYIWNKNNPDVDVIKLLRNGDQNTVIAVGRYTYLVIPNWHTSVPSGSGRRPDRNFSNQSA